MVMPSRPRFHRFTRLYATISQEEDAFTVAVRLLNHLKPNQVVWGEEPATSVEMASAMINALAEQFAIPQSCIAIKIRMASFKQGTLH
jgi:hypothetical protein